VNNTTKVTPASISMPPVQVHVRGTYDWDSQTTRYPEEPEYGIYASSLDTVTGTKSDNGGSDVDSDRNSLPDA